MHTVIRSLALLPIVGLALGAQGTGGINTPAQRGKPYVILVSFDGMRPEYLDRINLPNFRRVIERGVRAEGMLPVFPSKTFPNHYSIVTGMYAEHHGLVGNRFWDPARNAGYGMGNADVVTDGSWYRGEPIWSTAEKQGMVAASFFWVASEAAIAGARPSIYKRYDGRIPNLGRVDTVLAWLAFPAERRPHMITLYFSEVDGAGHSFGPLSPQVDTAAWNVDQALGRLLDGLARSSVRDSVYLLLVSDHGMSETSPRWYAALDTLIDLTGVQIADAGPNANLHVNGGAERARVLRDSINRRMRHGRAYLRADVPARLRYNKDPRIGDIVVIMDDHFTIGTANRAPREGSASHGWEPVLPTMHAMFLAMGPGIPAGKTIPVFSNVEIYPFMAEVLGLRPAAGIDGRSHWLANLIRRE
ncbi:MAG: ectonucleotide pyrophosphatase/phosphodiesterase [Gemmatimonadaceae bacterium]